MKTVQINRMDLHYFKGVENRTIEFGDEETIISGPNGCGKSTIVDAFFWCLWGKNAAGQSDQKFLIKTVDRDGIEVAHVNHEVEMLLTITEDNYTTQQLFKRTLVPEYDKDGYLKGNHTEYSWNDVPCKKKEYDEKVAQLISEEVFKLITSPYAFLNMDWQKQRDALMKMAGEVSNEDVAATAEDGRYDDLLGILAQKSIDEYRRELDSKLRLVNDQMKDIPARIDEVRRNSPEEPDMAAIECQRNALQQQLDEMESIQSSEAERINAINADRNLLSKNISDLKWKQQQILQEAEAKERNEIHASNKTYNDADAEYKTLIAKEDFERRTMDSLQKSAESNIAYSTKKREELESRIIKVREEWVAVNGQQFEADDYLKCPLYGHTCQDTHACGQYDANQGAAYATWESRKKQKLAEVQQRGTALKEEIAAIIQQINTDIESLNQGKEAYKTASEQRQKRLNELENIMATNPKRPLIASVKGEQLPEWIELQKQILTCTGQLNNMMAAEASPENNYREAKMEIQRQLAALTVEEAKSETIAKNEARIKQLEEELKTLGGQKSEIEWKRSELQDFEIAKVTQKTAKVNGLFKLVRWQMFQRQVNGEEVPACIAVVGGVRWTDANTASRINAGIDVASALSTAYGVSAPMFIDNAECSGNIYNPHTSQRILLRFDRESRELSISCK